MKTTEESLFSNGNEFMTWQSHNCDRCVKQSHYNEKNDTYSAYRCSIDRDIGMQQVGLREVNLKSLEATHLADCPYRQTERKKVHKKRDIKYQLKLEI